MGVMERLPGLHGAADAASVVDAMPMELLAFRLGQRLYAIDLRAVEEVRGFTGEPGVVRPVAGSPDWLRGVVTLRGAPVPAIDLRRRFNVGGPAPGLTVLVVASAAARTVVLMVDAISEVVEMPPAALQPLRDAGASGVALGEVEVRIAGAACRVTLLDVEQLSMTTHDAR